MVTESNPFRQNGDNPTVGSRPPTAPSSVDDSSMFTYKISSGSWKSGRSSSAFSSSQRRVSNDGRSLGLKSQHENIKV